MHVAAQFSGVRDWHWQNAIHQDDVDRFNAQWNAKQVRGSLSGFGKIGGRSLLGAKSFAR